MEAAFQMPYAGLLCICKIDCIHVCMYGSSINKLN